MDNRINKENKQLDFENIGRELDNDWTNFIIFEWDYLGEFNYTFEINPLDFLEYAKIDLIDKSQKGLINAMSNAKRAIECQIDSIIITLGYDYKKFDHRNNYLATKNVIHEYFNEDIVDGLTDRIKLLQILNITPTFLLSKIRNLRNKVEHEYIMPSRQEVKESIEIAELFIHSSMRKISMTNRAIFFGSKFFLEECKGRANNTYTIYRIQKNYICFEINRKQISNITLTIVRDKGDILPYDSNAKENTTYNISAQDEKYPYILKVMYTKDYSLLARIFGYSIKEEFIKFIIEEA